MCVDTVEKIKQPNTVKQTKLNTNRSYPPKFTKFLASLQTTECMAYTKYRLRATDNTKLCLNSLHMYRVSAAIVAIRKFNFQTGKTLNVNLEFGIILRARHAIYIFYARLIGTNAPVVYIV